MSQHEQHWDRTRTLIGFEQLFETDGASGSSQQVTRLFTWGAGLAERVVHDFTLDALTVANLRHPHIVHVADAGTGPDGTPFVVLERLRGKTLEQAAEAGLVPTAELLPILRGVASALSAAHAAGIVHGELRADNVFMADVAGYEHGFPKLLDFGVRRLTAAARGLGRVVDDPSVRTDHRRDLANGADERSDQFALAALADQLLTWTGHAAPSTDRVLTRAMSSNPAERFDSVASFFQALQVALTAAGPAPATPAQSAPEPASLTQQFFAEGEKQELAHADEDDEDDEDGADEHDAGADDAPAVSSRFDRIPRSRGQMIAAASLALASMAVMGWTVVSLSRDHDAEVSLSAESPPESAVTQPKAPPPAPAQARTADRRARLASVSAHRAPSRTEPMPAAATAWSARPDSTAAAPSPETAPTPPVADPPPPAAATPAAPIDEDVTQPWEQTDGEPTPAPVTEVPPAP